MGVRSFIHLFLSPFLLDACAGLVVYIHLFISLYDFLSPFVLDIFAGFVAAHISAHLLLSPFLLDACAGMATIDAFIYLPSSPFVLDVCARLAGLVSVLVSLCLPWCWMPVLVGVSVCLPYGPSCSFYLPWYCMPVIVSIMFHEYLGHELFCKPHIHFFPRIFGTSPFLYSSSRKDIVYEWLCIV